MAKRTVAQSGSYSTKFMHDLSMKTRDEHNMLIDLSDEAVESVDNPTWIIVKAVLLLLLGTVVVAVFADPPVDAVDNFSAATSIPSFFISFIAMPLAINSSEAVSVVIFASRKKQRTSSLILSEARRSCSPSIVHVVARGNVASWNAVITVLVDRDQTCKALKFFRLMVLVHLSKLARYLF